MGAASSSSSSNSSASSKPDLTSAVIDPKLLEKLFKTVSPISSFSATPLPTFFTLPRSAIDTATLNRPSKEFLEPYLAKTASTALNLFRISETALAAAEEREAAHRAALAKEKEDDDYKNYKGYKDYKEDHPEARSPTPPPRYSPR